MHGAHLPPVVASPPTDPLPKPWESFVSNATSFPSRFEALYQRPLLLAHPFGASVSVKEIHLTVMDPRL
jgi:hypothetical protein